MKPDLLELGAALSRRGEPFVLATVVWSRAPSSGKPGSTALITREGAIHGWLGGACAEPTVIRESLKAIAEGSPRVLFLGTPEELEAAEARAGMTAYRSPARAREPWRCTWNPSCRRHTSS